MYTKLLLIISVLFCFLAPVVYAESITGKVVSIADGDTITVLLDEAPIKVRFHGIDTPESKQDFGTAARNYTADNCFGEVVTVVVTDTDRYGRKVGLVILDDGRVLNHELVAQGLAHWYADYAPRDESLKRLEEAARAAKRGLWSRPDVRTPQDFRQGKGKKDASPYNPPSEGRDPTRPSVDANPTVGNGNTVYITESGTRYHKAGCRFLKNSRKAISLDSATRNYTACGVCKP